MTAQQVSAELAAAAKGLAAKKAKRSRGRADVAGIDAAVELLNQQFAMVLAGRAMIIRERVGVKGYLEHDFYTPGDLRAWCANDRYHTASGKNENIGDPMAAASAPAQLWRAGLSARGGAAELLQPVARAERGAKRPRSVEGLPDLHGSPEDQCRPR